MTAPSNNNGAKQVIFMTDNIEKTTPAPKDVDTPMNGAPTKVSENGEQVVPVKYNKEIINLSFERAVELAQKGMKFEALSAELELLKELAAESGKTVMQFLNSLKEEKADSKFNSLLEKCGDDEALADEVKRLYNKAGEKNDGFKELSESFPEIKDISDLPESVIENAKLNGRPLLDEYLRYRLQQEKAIKENILSQQRAKSSSAGSQLNKSRGENPEAAEFLKGLWRK